MFVPLGLVYLRLFPGHGVELYRGSRTVWVQDNKGQRASRRIVLKPGYVSVIAGSISYLPKKVRATRRGGGCPLGRDSKRHQKWTDEAELDGLSGRDSDSERFLPQSRGGLPATEAPV